MPKFQAKIDYAKYVWYNNYMREIKSPLIKSVIGSIKSALVPKTAEIIPHALFAESELNKDLKKSAKSVFKQYGKDFEKDLQGMFNFITNTSNAFGAGFYSKSGKDKSLLTLKVNNFYKQYGQPANFKNATEFMEGISLFLSERITSRVQKVTPEEKEEESFSAKETETLETYREQLLNQFSIPENFSDPTYGFMFKIAHNEFSSCSLSKVKNFVEILQQDIAKQSKFYSTRIKELEIEKRTSKDGSLDRSIDYCKSILSYYKSVGVIESSFTFIRNKSLLNQPDNMLTILVDKNVDTSKFQTDLTMLQQVNNLLVCMNNGLLSKDVFFNGKNFVCQNPNYPRYPFIVNDGLRVIEQLPTLTRENQSLLAYNEDHIKELLSEKKYPITKISVPAESGQTRELTLYSTRPVEKPEQLKECTYPLFVKSFTTSQTDENAELMLFAVAGPDISLSTQICRIDKVPPVYRGRVSGHKQTSGEVIESNTHIHTYNLFDKVINQTPQKYGHFDISVNFNLDEQVSNEELESFFDNWCGIPKLDEQQTLVTQTDDFAKLITQTPINAESSITECLPEN